MLRSILKRLSRGWVIKRRLPARFGRTPLYVAPEAQLKYLKPSAAAFDSALLAVAHEHVQPGSVVWDIGANVGVFAFAAAARGANVLAIEADVWLVHLIRKSAALTANRCLAVDVLPVAISDRLGVATFTISASGRTSNGLEATGRAGKAADSKVSVPTMPLDFLLDLYPVPAFVKIDVEGAELKALQGAQRLLKDVRPAIYIETGRETFRPVSDLLESYGYRFFDGSKPLAGQTPQKRCGFNTLAVAPIPS